MASRDYTVRSRFADGGLRNEEEIDIAGAGNQSCVIAFDIEFPNGVDFSQTQEIIFATKRYNSPPVRLEISSDGRLRFIIQEAGYGAVFWWQTWPNSVITTTSRIRIVLSWFTDGVTADFSAWIYAGDLATTAEELLVQDPTVGYSLDACQFCIGTDQRGDYTLKDWINNGVFFWNNFTSYVDAATIAGVLFNGSGNLNDPATFLATYPDPLFAFYGPEAARGYNFGTGLHLGLIETVAVPEDFTYSEISFTGGGPQTNAFPDMSIDRAVVFGVIKFMVPQDADLGVSVPSFTRFLQVGSAQEIYTLITGSSRRFQFSFGGLTAQTQFGGLAEGATYRVAVLGYADAVSGDAYLELAGDVALTSTSGGRVTGTAAGSATDLASDSAGYFSDHVGGEPIDAALECFYIFNQTTGSAFPALADFWDGTNARHPVDIARTAPGLVHALFGPLTSYGMDLSGNNAHFPSRVAGSASTGGLVQQSDLPGLVAEFNAANQDSLSLVTENVSAIADLAGSADLTQTSGSLQPEYNRFLGGVRGIDLPGSNERLLSDIGAVNVDLGSGAHLMMVGYADALVNDVFGGGVGSSPRFYIGFSDTRWRGRSYSNNRIPDPPIPDITEAAVVSFEVSPTAIETHRANGYSETYQGSTNGDAVFVRLIVGSVDDNNTFSWDGFFGGMVLRDQQLSTDDWDKAEGALAWFWGLEGALPNAHPYKAAAPTQQISGNMFLADVSVGRAQISGGLAQVMIGDPSLLGPQTGQGRASGLRPLVQLGRSHAPSESQVRTLPTTPGLGLGRRFGPAVGVTAIRSGDRPVLRVLSAFGLSVRPAGMLVLVQGLSAILVTRTPLVSHPNRTIGAASGSRTLSIKKENRDGRW